MKTAFNSPVVIGVSRGGGDFLIADASDPIGGGQIVFTKTRTVSDLKPIDLWVKWRSWTAPSEGDRRRFTEALGSEKALLDLMTGKAWDESAHPRHAAGDERGGEFAPKEGGGRSEITVVVREGAQAKLDEYGIADQLEEMFDLHDANIRGGVRAILKPDGRLRLQCVWSTKEGITVGNTVRIFSDGETVKLEELSFEKNFMLQGYGMRFQRQFLKTLANKGFKKATLYAEWVGRYAWAKEGFDYTNKGEIGRASNRFRSWLKSKNIVIDGDLPAFRNAKDIAEYRHPGGVTMKGSEINAWNVPGDLVMPLGKAFMLDRDGHGAWDGEISLAQFASTDKAVDIPRSASSGGEMCYADTSPHNQGSDAVFWAGYLTAEEEGAPFLTGSSEKALLDLMTGKAWDESQHPRHEAGDERGGEFASKEGGGSVASSVAAAIKKAKPSLSEDALQMYMDAMSLDKERFVLYAKRIGMEDAEGTADAFFKEQKEISRKEATARWDDQIENTMKDPRGGVFHHSEPVEWILTAAEADRPEATISDLSSVLSDRFGISISISNDFGGDVHGDTERLANLIDALPSIKKVVGDKVNGIRFLSQSAGTAIAQWNTITGTIDVYKGKSVSASTWIHELGHAAESYLPDGIITESFDTGKRVSGYAWGNYSEDFAETFAMIAGGHADQVAEFTPEKARVFQKYLPWLFEGES